jgi:hypothetical protein
VQVGGETFLVAVQGITAIRAKDMQDKVADLANEGEAVLRALDRLLTPP